MGYWLKCYGCCCDGVLWDVFLPTSCRWSSVLLFGHVGIVSCFRLNIRHKLCTWADTRCFSVGINWCLRWGSFVCCISFLLFCVKGLVSECRTCGQFALGCFLSWRFPWFFGLAGLRWTGFWDNATLLSVFYKKPAKKPLFVHHQSALPKRWKTNFIRNERRRIQQRCSTQITSNKHDRDFDNILRLNGYPERTIHEYTNITSEARHDSYMIEQKNTWITWENSTYQGYQRSRCKRKPKVKCCWWLICWMALFCCLKHDFQMISERLEVVSPK